MANRRLPLHKIKEVLRLKYECNLSEREIARSCQVSLCHHYPVTVVIIEAFIVGSSHSAWVVVE
jgi:hypothetical protein